MSIAIIGIVYPGLLKVESDTILTARLHEVSYRLLSTCYVEPATGCQLVDTPRQHVIRTLSDHVAKQRRSQTICRWAQLAACTLARLEDARRHPAHQSSSVVLLD